MRFSRCPHATLLYLTLLVTSMAMTGEVRAQEKAPVPDETAEQVAKKAAGEIYGGRFALAQGASDKTALAAEMITAAAKMQNGSADQFVLLRIARDIAVGAGDAEMALSAVKELIQRFDVPTLAFLAETLLATAEHATTNAQRKAVAESAKPISAKLAEADEYELAIRVCETARAAALGAREFKLAAELGNQLPELKRLEQEFQAYRDARAVMEADPAEPAANFVAGRYLCFVKGDWEQGIPYWALGSDAALKAAALRELPGATTAEQQVAIGDAWWDAAEGKEGAERDTLRLRAAVWYRRAKPNLAGGLVGLKVKQRLEEVAKLGREIPTAPAKHPLAAPGVTSLTNPDVRFRACEDHFVVIERGQIRAVVVDNAALDLPDLPGHRAGYNGVASLIHARRDANLFVPAVGGLNFSHIHDGTTAVLKEKFEPRACPMQLRIVDSRTVEVYQAPTANWKLESCGRYELLDDGAIEYTFECIPRAGGYHHGYLGLFWNSYIHQPQSVAIFFRGRRRDEDGPPRWIEAISPSPGVHSTHAPADQPTPPHVDADFPLTAINHPSPYVYTEPWFFGVSHGMAYVQMFRARDRVWLAQSPTAAGRRNPSWDFQWFVPDCRVGEAYGFVMRAAYVPFVSAEQVARDTRRHREALNP